MANDATLPSLTGALEDYLETIYRVVSEQRFARVKDIAQARNVKPASVSPALKRLEDMGLIKYARREYVTLTDEGERQARRVYSRHQILTRFFGEVLLMPSGAAEEEACAIEHSLSDMGMDRMVRFFEFLTSCADGSPDLLQRFRGCSLVHDDVPECPHACAEDNRLRALRRKIMSVYDLKPGEDGKVTQIKGGGAIRQRLLDMGILPDVQIQMERVAPNGEPVWIKLDGSQLALRRCEAESVIISTKSE